MNNHRTLQSRTLLVRATSFAVILFGLSSCVQDEEPHHALGTMGTGATGGSGGNAGNAGNAGGGGVSGEAGNAGTAGIAGTAGAGGTAGTAGAAANGGTAGVAGGGGSAGACTSPSDCAGVDNSCQSRTCEAGQCGVSYVASGVATPEQSTGDCKIDRCDGSGNIISANDDSDLPDDQNPCTVDSCSDGSPSHSSVASGEACGGGLVCDGNGHCIGCLVATTCPGEDNECGTRTCTDGVCGMSYVPDGTLIGGQASGDCRSAHCNGSGAVQWEIASNDIPVDGNDCTEDLCSGPFASNPYSTIGTSCTSTGGTVCNGFGACVQCVTAASCPTAPNDCQIPSCNNGVCGFENLATGTVVSSQTAGDCLQNQCDGNGNVVSVVQDSDVPNDSNPCTEDLCSTGIASHVSTQVGTLCGQSLICDGEGSCVGCTEESQCPTGDDCKVPVCVAGSCGFSFPAAGTPTSAQTDGDCKRNECDGNGNSVSATFDSDVPNDNNQCTHDQCSNGTPSNPPASSGEGCSQGGSVCDGTGACVQCNVPSTCPGVDNDCQIRTCIAHTCGVSFTPAGAATTSQVTGDCKQNECDGSGNTVSVNKDSDLPADDGNQCTSETCTNGVAAHPARPVDSACNQNGGSFCSASAACVQCNEPNQCSGSDTECHARTCVSNTCGVSNSAAGTPTSNQTSGDCQQNQCDGNGNITSVAHDSDAPADDGNQCTSDVCVSGAPVHPAVSAGTLCAQGAGAMCDGAGSCVQCLVASDCAGTDTECHTRTCNAGVCGVSNSAAGTLTSNQTSGDCQQNQCDGNGNIVSAALDTDTPDDTNQCTVDSCAAGTPEHVSATAGTSCSQNNGSMCDGAGSCVQCLVASDCAGTDTECHTRTCNAGVCGVSNSAAGTLTSNQTSGDCQQNQCDGNGNITSVADNTDIPNDNNACTLDQCVAGAPSHPSAGLMFTQYYEGQYGSNRWIEITNMGNSSVSLSAYSVSIYVNTAAEDWKSGATAGAGNTFALSGTLLAGQSMVIGNSNASPTPGYLNNTVMNTSPNTRNNTVTGFTGNDSVVLWNDSSSFSIAQIVDVLSFTNYGNEGYNNAFTRISRGTGYDLTPGSDITAFPTVWAAESNNTVDNASASSNHRLGYYSVVCQ